VPTGIVVLLTGAGHSWDNDARLAIVRGKQVTSVALPDEPGRVLVRAITVRWPSIVVRGYLFTNAGRRTLHWQSADGGDTWHVD
jgi:hypothetical protein